MIEETKPDHVPPFVEYNPPFTDEFNLDQPEMIDIGQLNTEEKRKLLNEVYKRQSADSAATPWTAEHVKLMRALESQLAVKVHDAFNTEKDRPRGR